jgi:hypothetical protein
MEQKTTEGYAPFSYLQLATPSDVPSAVSTATMI